MSSDNITPGDDGMIRPPVGPGLGIRPDLDALHDYLVDVRIEVNGRVIYQTPRD